MLCLVVQDLYMMHSGGSSTTMAMHVGKVKSLTNLFNMVLAPAVGCLSDTLGRKPLMMVGRLGWAAWWLVLPNIDRLSYLLKLAPMTIRLWGETICWGVVAAGTFSAYQAAHADYFGTRPKLMGKIGTTGGIIWDLGQFSGSIIGAWLARGGVGSFGATLSHYISAACAIGTFLIFSTLKEPLRKEKRKPFRLSEANPIGSLFTLFSLGPGLKRLSVMTSLLYLQFDTWSVRNSYRLGAVGFSSSYISLLNTWAAVCMMFSQGSIVIPLTHKRGYPFAFCVGALGGAVAYVLEGTSWIAGSMKVRLLHYIIAQTVYSVVFEICGHCIRPMITKQGIAASTKLREDALSEGRPDPGEVGLGALSAAVNNLRSILGIVAPIAW
jgi:DHA1 family tetracycline resistance protein-like MFS transporter